MLTIKNLSASIEGKSILKNINLSFANGSTTALLGPNGSGKSTLGNTLLAAPFITLSPESRITLDETDLTDYSTAKRAEAGIFLTFQSPLPLAGVSALDMLRSALVTGENKRMTARELHDTVTRYCEELNLSPDFLKRSLYEGFSGGERKKMEALQVALFAPRIAIFDELDTGVDVDALKTIVTFLKKNLSRDTTKIFITHSHKLLSLVHPEHVVVLKNGEVVAEGDENLAHQIEQNGFENL